ncbi:MAG: undecaprenyl-diphosphate phosphatase [bacterium]|nr:undecaprenyl-diphosphate phosphatase [bacterium]
MDYLHTIIMGIVQGLTEFLPVSSSGHIVLTSVIYKLLTGADFTVAGDEEVFLDIMLHFGTLVAICIYFRNEIMSVLRAFWAAIKTKKFENYESMLPVYIIVGTFFTCLIVYPIKDFCENLLTMPYIVGMTLMTTGLILLISEILSKRISEKISVVNMKKSILIGIAQGLAAIPGISRSGSTIATALALGIDRASAARYSFLLSVPVIMLAVLYKIPEILKPEVFSDIAIMPILTGTVVSAVVGYFCIKYFMAFLNKFSLNIFAYYCMVVGLFVAVYFGFFA